MFLNIHIRKYFNFKFSFLKKLCVRKLYEELSGHEEATTGGVIKKVFLKETSDLIKKEASTKAFSSEFANIFKNTLFIAHHPVAASEYIRLSLYLYLLYYICRFYACYWLPIESRPPSAKNSRKSFFFFSSKTDVAYIKITILFFFIRIMFWNRRYFTALDPSNGECYIDVFQLGAPRKLSFGRKRSLRRFS